MADIFLLSPRSKDWPNKAGGEADGAEGNDTSGRFENINFVQRPKNVGSIFPG